MIEIINRLLQTGTELGDQIVNISESRKEE